MPVSSIHSAFSRSLGLSLLFLSGFLLAAAFPTDLHAQDSNQRRVELALIEGDVQLQQPDGQIVKAAAHMRIQQGATLTIGVGLAEIYFEDGASGYLSDSSKLVFTELDTNGNGRVTRLTLIQGTARFFANTRGVNVFSIETPNFTVSPNPLVDFSLTVDANGSAIIVARGTASVSRGDSTWTVNRGETSFLANGATEAKTVPTPLPDVFQTWFPVYAPILQPQFPSGITFTQPVYPLEPIPIPTGPAGIPRFGPRPPHPSGATRNGHVRP